MAIRPLQVLFSLSIIGFLIGGVAIVAGQALGIVLGDSGWVADVETSAGPPTFITAGISGLLAFVLSYTTSKEKPEAPAADIPGPQHATTAPRPE
ncbi:hypothetical protein ACWY4P_48615 [Streptomyces sp. LZ34]